MTLIATVLDLHELIIGGLCISGDRESRKDWQMPFILLRLENSAVANEKAYFSFYLSLKGVADLEVV